MPPMANKNLDKCVLLLRQMMDRDSGSVSSSSGKKLGQKKKSKRVSVLTTAARPKVKKKDAKVVTTRKIFSKTKLNVETAKKPRAKLTSAPRMMGKRSFDAEDVSHRPEREFQRGKATQLPEKLLEYNSGKGNDDGLLQPKSAIHFDKPFTALQPPRQSSQPLDGSITSCLSRPVNQSDTTQQSGAAPPFNQRLLSSTPQMTPVKVCAEVTNADPLPLNSTDQIRAVRPSSPPPIIPRLFEGVVAFQPQPCPNVTSSARIEPVPPFIGVTSQYIPVSTSQEQVQSYEGVGCDPQSSVGEFAGNLPVTAWLDDYPVKDGTSAAGYAPVGHGQPCIYPVPQGYTGTYPASSSVYGQTQVYPVLSMHGQMGPRPPSVGQPTALTHSGLPSTSGHASHIVAYTLPPSQFDSRPYQTVSGVNNVPATISCSQEEHVPSSAAAVVDFAPLKVHPMESKDSTLSPPVKEKSDAVTPVRGEYELYSDSGTPVTHNPRCTSRGSNCANGKRPPVRSRASESQKLTSSRMSAGVGARTSKSLDRNPKSASHERKKHPKTKTKTCNNLVDAEVQVGTPGGTHQCDCETETEGSDQVTQVKVNEDMEKNCSAARSHLHTLSYLLQEIKTVAGITGHGTSSQSEICRLVSEMEQTVSSLLPGVTTLSWQTEIDLAMLPLRSENAQLRRRVRILTQQLKEKAREVEETLKPDPTFEVVQLQMNEHQLRKDLGEERVAKEKLAQEFALLNEDFRQVTTQKQELLQVLTNKERAHQKALEERQQELTKAMAAQEAGLKEQEKQQTQVEEATNKMASLEVSLKERDRELSHMHSLVRSLQSNMTSLLSDLHGSRLQVSDFDRSRPQTDMQHQDNVSEANVIQRQERVSLPPATTSDRDALADSACYSRGSDSLTPSTRSRRELNFNAQQPSPSGATANWAATVQHSNSPQRKRDDMHRQGGSLSSLQQDSTGASSTRLKKEDLHQLCGLSPQEGDSSMATDYMVPPGVSPMRKLHERGVQEQVDAPSDGPTVKQMLVALAGKIQAQQRQEDHMSVYCVKSSDDAESTLENNQVEEEVVWTEFPRDKSDVCNETRYSVTDYFSKYRQCSKMRSAESAENEAESQRSLQLAVYRDTDLDTTISSIHDLTQLVDESFVSSLASSVSSLASSVSVDDQVFREGLNSLDATIAQIQQTIRQAMYRGQRSGGNQLTYVKR